MGTELTEKQIQKAIAIAIKAKAIEKSSEEDFGVNVDKIETQEFRKLKNKVKKNIKKREGWKAKYERMPTSIHERTIR